MNFKINEVWSFVPCCEIVRGNTRALIEDPQRNLFKLIPLDLADLLLNNIGTPFDQMLEYDKYEDVIKEYIEFLVSYEFIQQGTYLNNLNKMSMSIGSDLLVSLAAIANN